jgi:cholesterol transport system auxiliary component
VSAANAVTIRVPEIAKELRTTRVPVQIAPTQVQYVTDLEWVDTPDRLFQSLLSETVRRTTGRLVLSPDQSTIDPGTVVTGSLQSFGYDAQRGVVAVRYDAAIASGDSVRSRSFTAEVPSDGTAGSVAPALNQAANEVATEVAQWIGG